MNRLPEYLYKPIRELNYALLDLETTGFKPGPAQVTEVAIIRVENGIEKERYQQLIDPEQQIPYEITRLTGINGSMVYGQPTFGQVIPKIQELFKEAVFVSHNVPFDWKFFDYNFRKYLSKPLIMPSLCTLHLSRKLLSLPSNKLENVAKHFNVSLKNAHRAMNDTLAVKGVLNNLFDVLEDKGIETGEDLYKKGFLWLETPAVC